jgi:hypothetical protein
MMGMFDSIIFKCPNCGQDIEDQSKAGECLLYQYDQSAVPLKIAGDILNDEMYCENCKETFVVGAADYFPPPDIKMKLLKKQ